MIIQGGRLQGARYQDRSPYITDGLVLFLDAGNAASYPGSGANWYDLSGHGNDVTLGGGGVLYTAPNPWITLQSNGYFYRETGNGIPTGTSSYTLSAWVQFGSTWNTQGVMAIGSTWGLTDTVNALRSGTTNQLINYWWGNDLSLIFSPPDSNAWFNVVATYDSGTSTRGIWVNASSIGTDNPGPPGVSTSVISIGVTNNTEFLNANIGQAMIYNRALTSGEITFNFNNFKGRYGL